MGALRENVPGDVYPTADEYTSKLLRELGSKQAKRNGEPRRLRASPSKKVVKKTKKVTNRAADPIVSSSTVSSLQSIVVLENGSGSEDLVIIGRRKWKHFDLASGGEDL